ncbi:Abi family protein [Companilactobacillus mishanensis]|uniref:Abi family protein n=1 Tax=Companilactobacillus mishanensis TaxID=2486008 RepID=UPI0015625341|nr:Abi family protein [Companilactobacillus mishanensis]
MDPEMRDKNINAIEAIGYYTLKQFAYPFAYRDGYNTPDYDGLEFDFVVKRYYQDKNLRINLLHAIEDIEVSMNSLISHVLGNKYGAFGYLDFSNWADNRISKYSLEERQFYFKKSLLRQAYNSNILDLDYRENLNADKFPTVWLMTNLLTFETTSTLIRLMSPDNVKYFTDYFDCTCDELISWLECLNFVRNICCHNSNLLDITLSTDAMAPKDYQEFLWFKNINGDISYTNKIALVIVIVVHMMYAINPKYRFDNIKRSFTSITRDIDGSIEKLGFKNMDAFYDIFRK